MPAFKSILVAAFVVSVAGPGPAWARADQDRGAVEGRRPLPKVLQLPPGFQPEGIASGKRSTLFVAGFANGGIYEVDARTGEGDFLVPPQTNGRKAVGLKLQAGARRLVVAGGDTGHAYIYDARTGASLADLTLATVTPGGPGTFINDVVLTDDAAYFTESFRPVFYRVALGSGGELPEQADVETIPLTGDYESVDGFNANGIEETPRGDLIIVNGGNGKLYRVDPDSGRADLIDLGGGSVVNGDGLVLLGRTLYVVQNFSNQVSVLELSRRFNRGEIVETITDPGFDIPATAAFLKGALYVTNARFSTPPAPDTSYTVVRVPIEP
jgi:sugar lactone lactonase YvrE